MAPSVCSRVLGQVRIDAKQDDEELRITERMAFDNWDLLAAWYQQGIQPSRSCDVNRTGGFF